MSGLTRPLQRVPALQMRTAGCDGGHLDRGGDENQKLPEEGEHCPASIRVQVFEYMVRFPLDKPWYYIEM